MTKKKDIKAIDESEAYVAARFQVERSTVSMILKKKDRIKGSLYSTKKRDRPSEFPKLEEYLMK